MPTMERNIDSGSARYAPRMLPVAYRAAQILGRGYSTLNRLIFAIFKSELNAICTMRLKDGSTFSFVCSDKYYNQLFSRSYLYEPDLYNFFSRLRNIDFDFFDIGANFGYWSVLMSSECLGKRTVISVELDASTFKTLHDHAVMNNNRFSVLHAGIFDKDDVNVTVSSGHHSTRHIQNSGAEPLNAQREFVKTIRIDSLVTRYNARDRPILIKLDVEGAEMQAISGIGSMSIDNMAIILEEHGKDDTHSTTRAILNDGRFECYFIQDDGTILQIYQITILSQLKRNRYRGYNILALPKLNRGSSLPLKIREQTDLAHSQIHS